MADIDSIVYELEIKKLKSKARKLYESINDELNKVDCGTNLATHINPQLRLKMLQFNTIIDVLESRGENPPTFRYEIPEEVKEINE